MRADATDQAVLERHRDGLGPGPRPELGLGVADVGLHGRRRELEQLGDLLVGGARGQQREHLALARGRARAPARSCDHATALHRLALAAARRLDATPGRG